MKLYSLIWKRAVASQMSHAIFDTVAVDMLAGPDGAQRHVLRANGSTLVKAGITGQRWCVFGGLLATGATASSFVVYSAATALTGTIPIVGNAILDLTQERVLWVSPTSGDALNIDPGAGDIDGWLTVAMLK